MQETYIDIMIQSLERKTQVLDTIIACDDIQREQLQNPELTTDAFDEIVEKKSDLIEQLNQLDSGFEKLYERVKEELQANQNGHTDKIARMQELIRGITDRSMQIQAQEARNKELMMQKFTGIKERSKKARVNYKAASQYYKNMMQSNIVDPQFMDKNN